MPITSVASAAAVLREHGLLPPEQLDELSRLLPSVRGPRELAAEFVRRDWLTPYQANQVFAGRGADLVLEPYILLERLGEGAWGRSSRPATASWGGSWP